MGRPNVNVVVGGPIQSDYPKAYNTVYIKPNIPFASQVTDPNTKYVIRHKIDLGAEEVTIPENCVLEFDGGNVNNGKLVSNDTEIIGQLPENTNTLYGQYYKDKEPVNYNLRIAQRVNTGVEFAFMTPADYVSYRFYPQGIAVFYYNDSKYHLVTGNIEGSSPERAFMLLFDENYDFLGSAETPWPGHGGGLAICDNQLYMGCNRNPDAEYSDKLGIAVYNLSDVVSACSNYDGTPHSDVYPDKIQAAKYISLPYPCVDIDYDSLHEEFAVCHARLDAYEHEEYYARIYDKEFNEKRCVNVSPDTYIANKIESNVLWQGFVYKNGIIYGTLWISDYPAVDRGSNMFYAFDTMKDRVVSFEKMSLPYQDCECEGLFRDPDDDNNMYFMAGSNIENSLTILGVCKVSQINDLYGKDAKREGRAGTVNGIRATVIRVRNNYDYSNGPSNGSSLRPYKTIGTAIAMMYGVSSEYMIGISGASGTTDYILPRIRIGNVPITFIGVDGTPTVVGSVWSFGATTRLQNLNIIANNNIYASGGGYLFIANTTISKKDGLSSSVTGIQLADNATAKLENIKVKNCNTGIYSGHANVQATTVEVEGCTEYAINCVYSSLGIQTLTIKDCPVGLRVARTPIDLGSVHFDGVYRDFHIDDSPISIWAPNNITIENVPEQVGDISPMVIYKDADFRGRVNLACKAQTNAELASFFAMMKCANWSSTSVSLTIDTKGLSYNGKNYQKGVYIYNNPGFILEGYPHTMVVESNGDFDALQTEGTIEQRPVLTSLYAGFQYFDKTIQIPVVWTGYNWLEIESTPDSTNGYWTKIGEMDGNSGSINGSALTITDSTYTSQWEGWTNAVDNTIYRKTFDLADIPFNTGDVLKLVIKNATRNTELIMRYHNSNESIELIHSLYNRPTTYIKTPDGSNYNVFYILIHCDVGQFDGTVEIYKLKD